MFQHLGLNFSKHHVNQLKCIIHAFIEAEYWEFLPVLYGNYEHCFDVNFFIAITKTGKIEGVGLLRRLIVRNPGKFAYAAAINGNVELLKEMDTMELFHFI